MKHVQKFLKMLLGFIIIAFQTPVNVIANGFSNDFIDSALKSVNLEGRFNVQGDQPTLNKLSNQVNQKLAGMKGYDAQMDFTITLRPIVLSDVPHPLPAGATLPAFLFAPADFQNKFTAGLQVSQAIIPTNFFYEGCFIAPDLISNSFFGVTPPVSFPAGSLIIVYSHRTAGTIDGYHCIQVECHNTGYGLFLNSLLQDKFKLVWVRMSVDDPTLSLSQLSKQWHFYKPSNYGSSFHDSLNPTSQKTPLQNQANIIDIPVDQDFDKLKGIQIPIDGSQPLILSLFVKKNV